MLNSIISKLEIIDIKGILHIFFSKIIIILLGFVSSVIIVRTLGLEGVGSIAAFTAFMGIISSLSHLGLPVSNIYYISRVESKKKLLSNSLLFVLLIVIVLMIIILIFSSYIKQVYMENIDDNFIYLIFIGILLSLHKTFFSSFLRGLERFKEFAKASILEQLVRVMLIFTFYILYELSIENVILITYASVLIANSYRISIIKKEIPFSLTAYEKDQFFVSLRYGLKDFIGYVANTLTIQIDIFILAIIASKEDIGMVVIATALATIIQYSSDSIGSVILSKISNSKDKKQSFRIMKISLLLNTIVSLILIGLLFASGKYLIEYIYKIPSSEIYELTLLYAIGMLILGNVLIIAKYISGSGFPFQKSLVRIYSLPFKLLTLYLFVQYYGIIGAAYSFISTTLLMMLISLYFVRKIYNGKGLN